MNGVRRAIRFLASLAAVVAMLIGVPALLIVAAGWPLPTYLPDPADVILAIEQGNIPSTFVVHALAVVGWIVWLQFAWAMLWELFVNARRMSDGGQAAPAPLVASKMHGAAARLLASLLTATVVSSTAGTSLALAGSTSASSTVSAVQQHAIAAPHRPASVAAQSTAVCWRATSEDSLWSIAQTALGDGSRVGEILEANPLLTSPRSLRSGMVLQMPAGAVVPPDRSASAVSIPTAEGQAGEGEYLPPTNVTIVRGDTLWDLSEARMELVGDHHATPRETLDYLHLVIESNPEVIEDPNLIFPGEVFALPGVGEAPIPVDTHDSRPASVSATTTEPSMPTTSPPPVTDQGEVPTTATPAEPASPTRPPTSVVPTSTTAPSIGGEGSESGSPSLVAKLGLSAVLAGGVLALVRRASRRRAARDRSQAKALARLDLVQAQLVRRQHMTLHEWASEQLFRAAQFIAEHDLPGAPVAVELSPDGIEVLWDEPNISCLPPFEVIDAGWSWEARYDEEADTPDTPPEVVAPTLVTLGIREGRSLMVDLEAFGSITVIGDERNAESLVRSIALELASGEQLSNAYVSLVGFELGLEQHLPRAVVRTEAEAFRHLAGLARQQRDVLAGGDVRSSFHLRGASPAGREAAVVVVRAEGCAVVRSLLELAKPRSGVAVIVLADTPVTAAVIDVGADGSAALAALGLEFEAAHVEAATADELAIVVDAIDDVADDQLDVVAEAFQLHEPAQLEFPIAVDTDPSASEAGADAGAPDDVDAASSTPDAVVLVDGDGQDAADEEWPTPDLLVRVLGRPQVEHEAKLSQLETSLVAYLACRGGSVPTEDVMDAVWKGSLIERATLFNRLSKIRAKLGGGVAPIAKSDSTVRLDGVVVTDLQLLHDFYERAKLEPSGEAMQLLKAGLDLIEGPPFDGPGFEWAYSLQLHSAAMTLVRDATVALVDLAIESRDFALARMATKSGLRSARLSEEIYRARMRIEATAGNPAGVRQAYDELALLLDELGDGYEPDEETRRLLHALLPRRASA